MITIKAKGIHVAVQLSFFVLLSVAASEFNIM
jgi:hypothetical protein